MQAFRLKSVSQLVHLLLLILAVGCSPAANKTFETVIPKLAATQTPDPSPSPATPTSFPDLFPDYQVVFNSQTKLWEVQNQLGNAVAEQTADSASQDTAEWQINYEELAKDERINIFDANTFPEQYQQIANKWLEYAKTHTIAETEAQWQDYQVFVEAARNTFFAKEGISSEVAALSDINPNLKSLWGVIYWVQNNRDQAVSEQIMPVVTPSELKTIIEEEQGTEFWEDSGVYYGQPAYPRETTAGISQWWDASQAGLTLGRTDLERLQVPNSFDLYGDLALLARFSSNGQDTVLTITHAQATPDTSGHHHRLYVQALPLDPNFTLQVGDICNMGRVGVKLHPEPLPQEIEYGSDRYPLK
ncbi:MAG: hypothetical protein O3B43_04405 [Chloroflexi bacterium]|nr:hypothetical protein [Chloroflexota bacterium]